MSSPGRRREAQRHEIPLRREREKIILDKRQGEFDAVRGKGWRGEGGTRIISTCFVSPGLYGQAHASRDGAINGAARGVVGSAGRVRRGETEEGAGTQWRLRRRSGMGGMAVDMSSRRRRGADPSHLWGGREDVEYWNQTQKKNNKFGSTRAVVTKSSDTDGGRRVPAGAAVKPRGSRQRGRRWRRRHEATRDGERETGFSSAVGLASETGRRNGGVTPGPAAESAHGPQQGQPAHEAAGKGPRGEASKNSTDEKEDQRSEASNQGAESAERAGLAHGAPMPRLRHHHIRAAETSGDTPKSRRELLAVEPCSEGRRHTFRGQDRCGTTRF